MQNIQEANEQGIPMFAQVGSRPVSVLLGLTGSMHPFIFHKTWYTSGLVKQSLQEQIRRLRSDAELRTELLAEHRWREGDWIQIMKSREDRHQYMDFILNHCFEIEPDRPNYEPDFSDSIAQRALRQGREPYALALESILKDEGKCFLMYTHENYSDGDLEMLRECLVHPNSVCGLSDAGAHCGAMADASFPTSLIAHWTRDRTRGEKLPIEFVVRKQTALTAQSYGFYDRGLLLPGYKADINLIDVGALGMSSPFAVYDLPAGGRRLVQKGYGYRHTFVSGIEVSADGEFTGNLPGNLIRGSQSRPGGLADAGDTAAPFVPVSQAVSAKL